MSNPSGHSAIEITIRSADHLREEFASLGEIPTRAESPQRWLFRGHRCASWQLKPTVVRCADRNDQDVSEFETRCFKEFTRRAHGWFSFLPADDSTAEWLAWMQHYGAPTRVLDVTESPWVATFFAIEDLARPNCAGGEASDNGGNQLEGSAAVWAIQSGLVKPENPGTHRDRNLLLGFLVDRERFTKNGHIDPYVNDFDGNRVEEMLPHLIHDRIQRQKGRFLFAFDLTKPACATLVEAASKDSCNPKDRIRKLLIPWSLRRPLMRELALMNIDADTLFPGPDGFGRSLRSLT